MQKVIWAEAGGEKTVTLTGNPLKDFKRDLHRRGVPFRTETVQNGHHRSNGDAVNRQCRRKSPRALCPR
ncbi:MAG: hypothetical protein A3A24_03970 [Candidatus Buchananbacteria bacterium RIFCSPLOWO2_01_FULL_46_12]|uniref:Uncharacterized protein n=2 Tax=Candidatus Buchananiibacteriota TaxID=1817903 RepID=A0A1G1YUB0_9BACT|nr:MAG: hypothetical protein A2744_01470 [Candidatus Buchananbacteria bacterium RIFCSPHIGHO2_01_FULL_44_11]OGY55859.1 MAG: hypothetical protein A3A24_03970 [Candidatus Buchananbacteria bacterium RIFCSPLOWO2_01_FULL_46_12]